MKSQLTPKPPIRRAALPQNRSNRLDSKNLSCRQRVRLQALAGEFGRSLVNNNPMNRVNLLPCLSVILTFSTTTSFSLVAKADGTTASVVPADDNERARALYRQATEAFEKMKPEEALAGFRESWNLRKTHDVALSLGQVELVLKKFRDAAEHLDFAIRHFPPMESGDMLNTARNALAEAKQQVGTLEVTVDRGGAEILVDSRLVGVAPLDHPLYLEPGQRIIEARDPSSPAATVRGSETITVEPGREQAVSLRLGPRPVQGTLSPTGNAERGASPVPLVLGGVLGLAGLGLGTSFALAAGSEKSRADSLRSQLPDGACKMSNGPAQTCTDLRDAVDAHDRDRNISTAGFVVGGAAILGTIGYWLFLHPSSEKRSQDGHGRNLSLRAAATTNEGALWLSGTW
jgi:hypothetical protein